MIQEDEAINLDTIIEAVEKCKAMGAEIENPNRLRDITKTIVNEDIIQHYMISNVINGMYLYILTNNRLIIITTDTEHKINSHQFSFEEMLKVIFKSPMEEQMAVEILLTNNDILGLKYSSDKENTTKFFQILDQTLRNFYATKNK